MKLHSRKSFLFVHPTDPEVRVSIQNEEMKIVPEWVADTLLFKLASNPDKSGNVDIFIIETREQATKADNGDLSLEADNKKNKKANADNQETPTDK